MSDKDLAYPCIMVCSEPDFGRRSDPGMVGIGIPYGLEPDALVADTTPRSC